jgi:outer membrane immunogenic protein
MNMKPTAWLVAAVSLGFGLGQNAFAADLPLKTPLAPPAEPSWSGLYLGFHTGWGWASDETANASSIFTGVPIPPFAQLTFPLNASGAIAGAQLGYNWQLASRWVFGIEGDASGTGLKASQSASTFSGLAGCGVPGAPCGSAMMTENVNWLASARGRLGYTFGPGLAYVTGGAAWANVGYGASVSEVFPVASTLYPAAFGATKPGWVYGAGYEGMLGNSWTLRAEYLHYGFDGANASVAAVLPNPVVVHGLSASYGWSPLNLNVLRLGVNYKF